VAWWGITVRLRRWGCQSRWSPQYRGMIWSSILPIFSIGRFWGRSVKIYRKDHLC
jgi:hypothetical protein